MNQHVSKYNVVFILKSTSRNLLNDMLSQGLYQFLKQKQLTVTLLVTSEIPHNAEIKTFSCSVKMSLCIYFKWSKTHVSHTKVLNVKHKDRIVFLQFNVFVSYVIVLNNCTC